MENRTGESWELIRERLEEISLSQIETNEATVLQTKRLTPTEQKLLNSCRVKVPPRVLEIA